MKCHGCFSEESFILDSKEGSYICFYCGTVSQTPVYQELYPFLWAKYSNSNSNNCEQYFDERSSAITYNNSTYVRYFHFNEIIASITLTGPWICNTDMRIIREELKNNDILIPTKLQIQQACKNINKKYNVRRFSQKYSEKWIQITWRYSKIKPEFMDRDLVETLRSEFRKMVGCWEESKELLNNSKNSEKRKQWPNYSETIYRLIKKRHPNLVNNVRKWIPRLSKKKRKDLNPFFSRIFYLCGWN
jgi:hypothetical protein